MARPLMFLYKTLSALKLSQAHAGILEGLLRCLTSNLTEKSDF